MMAPRGSFTAMNCEYSLIENRNEILDETGDCEWISSLVRELHNIRFAIIRLFASHRPLRSSRLIGPKLALFVELIGQFPKTHSKQIDEWTEEAALMMEHYRNNSVSSNNPIPGFDNYIGQLVAASFPLQQKLHNLESIIMRLFTLEPTPMTKLDVKITELVQTLAQSPNLSGPLTEHWAEKIGVLIRKYCSLQSKSFDANRQPAKSDISNGDDRRKSVAADFAFRHRFREKMPNEFAKIIIWIRNDNPRAAEPAIRRLVRLAAIARAIIDSHENIDANDDLYAIVVSHALARLPIEMRKKFANKSEAFFRDTRSKATLDYLINFMLTLLQQLPEPNGNEPKLIDEWTMLFHCKYCSANGHIISGCPILRAKLCFRCFNFGHATGRCGNAEPLIPAELL